MVKVKICGITNLKDAKNAIASGADALGFVFYKKSPRYISPKKACAIIKYLPKNIIKVGIFANSRQRRIKQIAKTCGLGMLQLHGQESPQFCAKFKKHKLIKAFRVKKMIDKKSLLKYRVYAFLFDAFSPSGLGGTGKKFNWGLFKGLRGIKRTIFLSGGLNPGNVKKAIRIVHPDWVDVSSGVEKKPGKKDAGKIRKFIRLSKQDQVPC